MPGDLSGERGGSHRWCLWYCRWCPALQCRYCAWCLEDAWCRLYDTSMNSMALRRFQLNCLKLCKVSIDPGGLGTQASSSHCIPGWSARVLNNISTPVHGRAHPGTEAGCAWAVMSSHYGAWAPFKPGKEEAEWTSVYVSVLLKSYRMQWTCFANKTISSCSRMTARQRRRLSENADRFPEDLKYAYIQYACKHFGTGR